MPRDDAQLWGLLERAVNHLALARFGVTDPRAQASLYSRAARLLLVVAERLLDRSEAVQNEARAGAMVRRAYE